MPVDGACARNMMGLRGSKRGRAGAWESIKSDILAQWTQEFAGNLQRKSLEVGKQRRHVRCSNKCDLVVQVDSAGPHRTLSLRCARKSLHSSWLVCCPCVHRKNSSPEHIFSIVWQIICWISTARRRWPASHVNVFSCAPPHSLTFKAIKSIFSPELRIGNSSELPVCA